MSKLANHDPLVNIYVGDVLDGLRALPAESVQCCVTSPPYFGLRDYGVQGQIGLEPTPDAYVARMVEVFREVRRVLRYDGVLLLNVGDSYNSSPSNQNDKNMYSNGSGPYSCQGRKTRKIDGLKPKDLIGIPWLLAFALRADGWYLRQDIIWHKPNPMPESVTDRCTKAHEYLFLLAKSERYYFDADAIKEPVTGTAHGGAKVPSTLSGGKGANGLTQSGGKASSGLGLGWPHDTRNRRSVWTISTRAFRGAHFATFPPDLVQPCIAAGSSQVGCCPACGKAWGRVVERTSEIDESARGSTFDGGKTGARDGGDRTQAGPRFVKRPVGWRPTCTCPKRDPIPCTVLDPFSGSGTTGAVARVMGRAYVGTELNPDYAAMWDARLADVQKWWRKRRGTKTKPKRASVKSMGESLLFNVA